MKQIFILVGTAAILTTTVAAQEQTAASQRRVVVEQAAQARHQPRMVLETRVTRGKPYSADAVTEFVHVLGDGNRIVRKTTARLYRDSDGRTRREDLGDAAADRHSIVITDPASASSFILDPDRRTAVKTPAMFARVDGATVAVQRLSAIERAQTPSGRPAAVALAGDPLVVATTRLGESTTENLGEQQIDGVTATGTRTTTVIPSGAIGNQQPITVVSEQWFSQELGVLVLTRHSDPRVGESTYRLVNISRSEPDRSLFQVPSDYTIQEQTRLMMRR